MLSNPSSKVDIICNQIIWTLDLFGFLFYTPQWFVYIHTRGFFFYKSSLPLSLHTHPIKTDVKIGKEFSTDG